MIITLTTDFGDSGGFVALLKARILSLFGDSCKIIDVTHSIKPFRAIEAAYLVRTVLPAFGRDSIHIVVVDPGVGTHRAIVACRYADVYIIGPEGEIFSLIEPAECVKVNPEKLEYAEDTHTFDAYGIMVPAAYALYKKGLANAGDAYRPAVTKLFPVKRAGLLKGRIVYIDRFGNAISNIELRMLEGFKRIEIGSLAFESLSKSYGFADDRPVALINSAGFLEFALFKDSFSQRFGVDYLDEVRVFFQ